MQRLVCISSPKRLCLAIPYSIPAPAGVREARLAADHALKRKNPLLAKLVPDLSLLITMLAARALEARQFAAEMSRVQEPIAESSAPPVLAGAPLPMFPTRLTRRVAKGLGMLAQGMNIKEIAEVR